MGRLAQERKVHLVYYPELVAHYKEQTQECKDYCASVGEPYGYSSMNVFFFFFYNYWLHQLSEVPRIPFLHKE
ncbi:MAG: hypothetical protein V3R52_07445 [Candidatus Neomarinimicrobiota bacterium]